MAHKVSNEASQIHDSAIVIDGCTFFFSSYNTLLRDAGTTAANFTVPLPMDEFPQAVLRIKEYYELVRRDSNSQIVLRAEDIRKAKQLEKFGIIIGCQNTRLIGTDLGLLEVFWRLGLRTLQLTYMERNYVGDGCLEPNDAGLSLFGRFVIREANNLGFVVDLAHASTNTALQAVEESRRPCIISHTGLWSRVEHGRNIPDDVARAVAESGGVVGLTTYPPLNWTGGSRPPSLTDFLDTMEYAIELVGIDHVGIGTDYEATPGGYPQWVIDYLNHTYDPYFQAIGDGKPSLQEVVPDFDTSKQQLDGFAGMQDMPLITEGLLRRGYGREDIQKILGGNFLRVFEEVWG